MTAARFVLFVGEACRPGVEDRAALARDGLRCLWTGDVPQAQRAARLARFDAAVVDAEVLGAPFGLSLARLRDTLGCAMVLIGAAASPASAAEEIEEILALELGAEVVLHRPVMARRLRAHLAALMRRLPGREAEPASDFRASASGWRGEVPLTDVQAALLDCLVAARGRIVPRDELIAALPEGHSVRSRTVDTHVHRLRRRLASTGIEGLDIESVHGRGYVLRGEPDALGPVPATARVAA
jgi:DNA-binding response OmpR family regulator